MKPDFAQYGFCHQENLIMAYIGGSQAHGAKLGETDDTDWYGLYVPPPSKVLGLEREEHFDRLFHRIFCALTVEGGDPYNSGLSIVFGGQMYAVIQTGGKQYRVAPGDTIRIERVKGDVGEQVKFGTVLAVHTDDKKILAGTDAGKASVTGKIVEQGRAKKLTVLKFKKTNQYKIQRGHRQNYTAVQVSEIKL